MTKGGWTRRGALGGLAAGAAACSPKVQAPPYEGNATFAHGVASGDPGPDRVIIWTRVTPQQTGAAPVRWVLARNRELTDIVRTGVTQTDETRDYTVKVDVEGLRPGAPYFYGFLVGDQKSPVGKTRTLPQGRLDQLKIAVVSCASYPHGFFNAYEAIGKRDDVDLVVHLGDYIYEYGVNGYGGDEGVKLGRVPSPEVECLSLSDYRLRHAQAKAEGELQLAHARAPWIVVWDDHEVADNDWMGGAVNHQPNEGDWATRKRAALQAYYEWMPIREPEPGKAFEAINRSFQFGDLMTLCMVETRLLARSKQVDEEERPILMQAWDFSNPNAPLPL
ncbi:MAG TPA: alkaline phosphatase D family protein, partial [Caulobacterales bacterium]|nr:alkaline phosphatase D family protein [Caulobacterales bacterium]